VALAQRIIKAIGQPFDLKGHVANIGTSIGIALAPEHGLDTDPLLTAADLALYDAKAGGRNDFRLFQAAMLDTARAHETAEGELRDAISREEFELHYQPVVDARTRALCGVEALVRWRHPTQGLLAPDQFLPLAESTRLIAPLGEWMIRQACADAGSLPDNVRLAVNLSAAQFRNAELSDLIQDVLAQTGLPAERLELEITESPNQEDRHAQLTTMRRLKDIGVGIVLDDVGSGHSSINFLTSFPFDKIKIDRPFSRGPIEGSDLASVVASTLALAQGLGIVTSAEGVETEQQLEYLRNAGVDLVQGSLFGQPVPIAEFAAQAALILDRLRRTAHPKATARQRGGSKMRA
jgi:predicted signal transduction protein with EAL and GGDEF domain